MPTNTPVTALNALNAANIRVPAIAPLEQKEGFQALLAIGNDTQDHTDKERRPVKEEDRPREILAAPVSGDATVQTPSVHDDSNGDARVRIHDNDNDNRNRTADLRDDRSADVESPDANNQTAPRPAQKKASTVKTVSADQSLERDDLLSELRSRLAFLDKMLQLFASLGGNPQAVQVQVDSVVVAVSTVTVTTASAGEIDVNAAALQTGTSADDLLKDILAQLAQLSAALDDATPDTVKQTSQNFFALLHSARQLALKLNDNTQAVDPTSDNATHITHVTRALVEKHSQLIAALSQAQDDLSQDAGSTVKTDTVVKITARQSVAEIAPQVINAAPVNNAAVTTPVTAAATASHVLAGFNADAQANAGDQHGGDQSLPQSIGAVRSTSQSQASQAANAPSFAQLLQQAKTPVLEQVMVQIKTSQNKSNIKIQLEPAELGKLEIKMHVAADGKTGISVFAENKDTLDLLQRDSRGLERALSDAGLKADSGSLSFNLRSGQQQGNQTAEFGQPYKTPVSEDMEAPLAPAVSRSYVVNITDGLDVTV